MRLSWLIGASLVLSSQAAVAIDCSTTDGLTFPSPDWIDDTAYAKQYRIDEIHKLEDYLFTLQGKDADRAGRRTDGLVIIQNGKLIYEKYGRGFTASNRHIAWSVTKSVAGALTGIAVADGIVTVGDTLCQLLPGVASSNNCSVTVKNMLEMSSGINWNEIYEDESNQYSSVLAMLYGEGHKDMARFVATHATRKVTCAAEQPDGGAASCTNEGHDYAPGSLWYYSTGEATLLISAVEAAMKKAGKPDDWQWTEFFDRIGMNNVTLERDVAGHSAGGSYLWATPRDLAKFGYLYLTDGCWSGQRILPEGWVTNASAVNPAMAAGKGHTLGRSAGDPDTQKNGDVYGQLWWLNRTTPEQTKLPWPDVEEGAYAAEGHWGQQIIVIPSKHMVIARTGDDRDEGALDMNEYIRLSQAVGH